MLKRLAAAAIASGMLLLAGCGPKPAPTVHDSMTEIMAPNAKTVWDTTSAAFNVKGDGLEATKLSQANWDDLEKAGAQLRDRALVLATAKKLKAASSGVAIMGEEAARGTPRLDNDWDAASAKQVQAWIDANPALFAQKARVLVEAGDKIVKASQAKDVKALYEVSSELDEVCDGCHEKFWGTDEPPPFKP